MALPYILKGIKGNFDTHLIADILQVRMNTLNEIEEAVDFFDELRDYSIDLYVNKKMKTTPEIALTSLKACKEMIENLQEYTMESIHDGYI